MRRAFLFIPGINQRPSRPDDWADDAVFWMLRHQHRAYAYEYTCPTFFRRLGQAARVKDCLRCVTNLGADGTLVEPFAHSNGCEILARMLREEPDREKLRLGAIHLVAAACDSDFEKNGLNDAVARGQVNAIHVYVSRGDCVLRKWATLSSWLGRPFNLGYGNLGFMGPLKASRAARTILHVHRNDRMAHSDWVSPSILPVLLERITGEE